MVQLSPSVLTGAAVAATAVVGGIGAATVTPWYRELDKPAWQPPGAVVGPVWPGVYAALAASTADLTRRSWAVDRPAGLALLPYCAWTAFAAALTAAIARRNG